MQVQYCFRRLGMKTIVLTGGGTAGHVTPHLALLPVLREKEFAIHYMGTRKGVEYGLITAENIPFHAINAGKLRRYIDLKNVTDVVRIAHAFIQSIGILLRIRPDVVFSKGGFVSCPVVWASWLLRIPVVIHESDSTPGLANQLSLPFAKKICYSFPETEKYLQRRKAVYTGLPVRSALFGGSAEEGRRLCGFTDNKPVLLVMGGSQGSVMVNTILREARPRLLQQFNICHICGKGNGADDMPGYKQFEYVTTELSHLFAASSLFIGRSGATTLFELLALNLPALFIPLATGASRGDQILNAESFRQQGYCHILSQSELSVESLVKSITLLYADRDAIAGAMQKCVVPNGVEAVFEVIKSVAR